MNAPFVHFVPFVFFVDKIESSGSLYCAAKQNGEAFPLPRFVDYRNPYFFLFWIMSCMIGDRMISIA